MIRKLTSVALALSAITLLVRVVNFVREVLAASIFGSSSEMDAWMLAFAIPQTIVMAFYTCVEMLLVPRYIAALKADDGTAGPFLRVILRLITTFAVISSVVLILFRRAVITVYAPGFPPGAVETAASLLVWLVPAIHALGIGNILLAMHNAHHRFLLPSCALFALSAVQIIALLFGHESMGIHSLALGQVAGTFLSLALIMIGVPRYLVVSRDAPPASRLASLMKPLSLLIAALLIRQVSEIVDKAMLSTLATGSISCFGYAWFIYQLPLRIFAMSMASIALVHFSWASGATFDEGRPSLNAGIKLSAMILLPLTAILMIFAHQFVPILLGRGRMTPEDSASVAAILVWLAPGLLFAALEMLYVRFFLALDDIPLILKVTTVSVVVHVLANFALMPLYGAPGIALSASISNFLSVALFFRAARSRRGGQSAVENKITSA